MRGFIKLIWYEWTLMKHDWFAQLMVFGLGLYWGLINNQQLSSEFNNFLNLQNEMENQLTNSTFLIMLLSVMANMIITCVLVTASGLLFGLLSIVFIAIQGMYSGFYLYSMIEGMYGEVKWWEYCIVGGFEIVSIFVILCAGALGLNAGRLMVRGFWAILSKKESLLSIDLRMWWIITKHNYLVLIFLIILLSIGKVGTVFLLS